MTGSHLGNEQKSFTTHVMLVCTQFPSGSQEGFVHTFASSHLVAIWAVEKGVVEQPLAGRHTLFWQGLAKLQVVFTRTQELETSLQVKLAHAVLAGQTFVLG